MTKKCEDCFDELSQTIEAYTGCKCPACIGLITNLMGNTEKTEGGVSKKSCLNGSCAADTEW